MYGGRQLAFEDELGYDPSQPHIEDYTLSAFGLVSKTIGLWTGKFVQYVVIVGLVNVALTLISFVVLSTLFGIIGVLETDPISYVFSIFTLTSFPDITRIAISITFAVIAFVIGAVLIGAAIKFALDDYAGQEADIRMSFSHSFGKVAKIVTVQLVMTFIVSIVLFPSIALMTRSLEGFDISDPYNPIITPEAIQLMMMGSILLLVGGIFVLYISTRLYPAAAIVVDTDLSAIDALRKSWKITSGNVQHVIGAVFLMGIVTTLLGLLGLGIAGVLSLNPYAIIIEVSITSLLFSALFPIFITVLYRDLMSRTEESDLPKYLL